MKSAQTPAWRLVSGMHQAHTLLACDKIFVWSFCCQSSPICHDENAKRREGGNRDRVGEGEGCKCRPTVLEIWRRHCPGHHHHLPLLHHCKLVATGACCCIQYNFLALVGFLRRLAVARVSWNRSLHLIQLRKDLITFAKLQRRSSLHHSIRPNWESTQWPFLWSSSQAGKKVQLSTSGTKSEKRNVKVDVSWSTFTSCDWHRTFQRFSVIKEKLVWLMAAAAAASANAKNCRWKSAQRRPWVLPIDTEKARPGLPPAEAGPHRTLLYSTLLFTQFCNAIAPPDRSYMCFLDRQRFKETVLALMGVGLTPAACLAPIQLPAVNLSILSHPYSMDSIQTQPGPRPGISCMPLSQSTQCTELLNVLVRSENCRSRIVLHSARPRLLATGDLH